MRNPPASLWRLPAGGGDAVEMYRVVVAFLAEHVLGETGELPEILGVASGR